MPDEYASLNESLKKELLKLNKEEATNSSNPIITIVTKEGNAIQSSWNELVAAKIKEVNRDTAKHQRHPFFSSPPQQSKEDVSLDAVECGCTIS